MWCRLNFFRLDPTFVGAMATESKLLRVEMSVVCGHLLAQA
jgi:hypothetical protein